MPVMQNYWQLLALLFGVARRKFAIFAPAAGAMFICAVARKMTVQLATTSGLSGECHPIFWKKSGRSLGLTRVKSGASPAPKVTAQNSVACGCGFLAFRAGSRNRANQFQANRGDRLKSRQKHDKSQSENRLISTVKNAENCKRETGENIRKSRP